jgi:hypothetical protein
MSLLEEGILCGGCRKDGSTRKSSSEGKLTKTVVVITEPEPIFEKDLLKQNLPK